MNALIRALRPLVVAGAVLGVTACGGKLVERTRVTSPDGIVQAVIVERESDATVPTPMELYLVRTNHSLSGEPVVLGDRFENLQVTWREPRFLELRYEKARIFRFTNFWQSSDVDQLRYVVEIRLKPKTDSFALP